MTHNDLLLIKEVNTYLVSNDDWGISLGNILPSELFNAVDPLREELAEVPFLYVYSNEEDDAVLPHVIPSLSLRTPEGAFVYVYYFYSVTFRR